MTHNCQQSPKKNLIFAFKMGLIETYCTKLSKASRSNILKQANFSFRFSIINNYFSTFTTGRHISFE